MKVIFTENLVHKTLFNTEVYGSNENIHNHANVKLESTEILEISL